MPKLTVFGSSVAKGEADFSLGGYADRLKRDLTAEGWDFSNVSICGDNSINLLARFERDLLPEEPDVVLIGLSLGNEGLIDGGKPIYDQFLSNIKKLVTLCTDYGMKVALGHCYPNNGYGEREYEMIQEMNRELDELNIPGINFLGALDDGQGHWTKGYFADAGHPNTDGHEEMYRCIPPGFFQCIAKGKILPQLDSSSSILSPILESDRGLSIKSGIPLHSFSLSFKLSSTERFSVHCKGNTHSLELKGDGDNWQLSADAAQTVQCQIPSGDQTIHISLVYSKARELAHLFINGAEATAINCRLFTEHFSIRPMTAGAVLGIHQLCLHRAAMTPNEVNRLCCEQLHRASLEIYTPLHSTSLENLALSDSKIEIL